LDLSPELFLRLNEIYNELVTMYSNFDLHHFEHVTGLSRYIPSLITKNSIDISKLHPKIHLELDESTRRLNLIMDSLSSDIYLLVKIIKKLLKF
jgi:hypothetical protein